MTHVLDREARNNTLTSLTKIRTCDNTKFHKDQELPGVRRCCWKSRPAPHTDLTFPAEPPMCAWWPCDPIAGLRSSPLSTVYWTRTSPLLETLFKMAKIRKPHTRVFTGKQHGTTVPGLELLGTYGPKF